MHAWQRLYTTNTAVCRQTASSLTQNHDDQMHISACTSHSLVVLHTSSHCSNTVDTCSLWTLRWCCSIHKTVAARWMVIGTNEERERGRRVVIGKREREISHEKKQESTLPSRTIWHCFHTFYKLLLNWTWIPIGTQFDSMYTWPFSWTHDSPDRNDISFAVHDSGTGVSDRGGTEWGNGRQLVKISITHDLTQQASSDFSSFFRLLLILRLTVYRRRNQRPTSCNWVEKLITLQSCWAWDNSSKGYRPLHFVQANRAPGWEPTLDDMILDCRLCPSLIQWLKQPTSEGARCAGSFSSLRSFFPSYHSLLLPFLPCYHSFPFPAAALLLST